MERGRESRRVGRREGEKLLLAHMRAKLKKERDGAGKSKRYGETVKQNEK